MTRRVLGLVLMASVLRLTAFDVRTECERHAKAALAGEAAAVPSGITEPATGGHEHHVADARVGDGVAHSESRAPVNGESDSVPKCCVVTGTCGGSTLAGGLVARVSVGDAFAERWTSALSAPRNPRQAPEPPPPKA